MSMLWGISDKQSKGNCFSIFNGYAQVTHLCVIVITFRFNPLLHNLSPG
jgi:hypothetical protein